MRIPRRIRFAAALAALFALLFAQIAGAAYACPQLAPALAAAVRISSAPDAMAHCAEMDKQNPTLCATQKQGGLQFVDHPGQPPVQPCVPARIVAELVLPEPACAGAVGVPLAFLHAAGSGPPIAIRHCCFRI